VVVVKFLYVTFLIHKEQFFYRYLSPYIKNNYKIGVMGKLGGFMGCFLVNSVFCVLHHKADNSLWARGYLYTRTRLRCCYRKRKKGNQFMVAVFSKSVVVQTKVPFNKTFCIVS